MYAVHMWAGEFCVLEPAFEWLSFSNLLFQKIPTYDTYIYR